MTVQIDKVAFLVGGAVRDKLLGSESKDLDYLVCCTQLSATEWLTKSGISYNLLVDKGSTAKIKTAGKIVDLTTTPMPVLGNLSKRDLTVNAIATQGVSIMCANKYCLEDMSEGRLRTVGDSHLTLLADPVRAIRAYRLRLQLSNATGRLWFLDEELVTAIADLPDLLANENVSRVRNEVLKLFAAGKAGQVLKELQSIPHDLRNTLMEMAGSKLSLRK